MYIVQLYHAKPILGKGSNMYVQHVPAEALQRRWRMGNLLIYRSFLAEGCRYTPKSTLEFMDDGAQVLFGRETGLNMDKITGSGEKPVVLRIRQEAGAIVVQGRPGRDVWQLAPLKTIESPRAAQELKELGAELVRDTDLQRKIRTHMELLFDKIASSSVRNRAVITLHGYRRRR